MGVEQFDQRRWAPPWAPPPNTDRLRLIWGVNATTLVGLTDLRQLSTTEIADESGCRAATDGRLEITRYLAAYHPEFLDEYRAIIAAASLDQGGPAT